MLPRRRTGYSDTVASEKMCVWVYMCIFMCIKVCVCVCGGGGGGDRRQSHLTTVCLFVFLMAVASHPRSWNFTGHPVSDYLHYAKMEGGGLEELVM